MTGPTPPASRREILSVAAAAAGLGLSARWASSAEVGSPHELDDRVRRHPGDADRLDAALERVDARLPDVDVHASNHVPMVAEALATLGRADAIERWVDAHLDAHVPATATEVRIDPADWRAALGHAARFADWRAHFQRELREDDWTAVIRRWVPRFAPGLAGAAAHGVIRTGHAARALAARDTAIRRRELANGLAYWAANHETLPWDGSRAPESSVDAALARVVLRRPVLAPPRGNFVTGLRSLETMPSFRGVAGLVDTRDPLRTLRECASAFARIYLANPDHRVAFAHAVTAPSAVRLLAPYLDEADVRAATTYAWQTAAGLYVVYGDPAGRAERASPGDAPPSREELAARAIATGGAHAIKLTEACLREHAVSADPALLVAARDAASTLTG